MASQKEEKIKRKKFPDSPEREREIRNRIVLIVSLTFVIGILLSINFYSRDFQNWKMIDKNLNLFLLINLNIILLLVVAILLIRNLIKVIYERRRRILGFRLKSKLILAFIVIATLPTLVFFIIANGFLTNSLNFWFQGQYSVVLKNSAELVNNFNVYWEKGVGHYAREISREMSEEPNPESSWLREQLGRYRLDGLAVYDESFRLEGIYFRDSGVIPVWQPMVPGDLRQATPDKPYRTSFKIRDRRFYRAAVPLKIGSEPKYLEAVRLLPDSWDNDLASVRQGVVEYEKILIKEGPIRANYITYLLLFMLLIIFASTWFGIYLAKSMVVPIETLVEGTHRIAKGDLNFQIDLQVDDEIGMLLKSFNKMTKKLRENQVKLANSQEELMDTNHALEARSVFVETVLQNIRTGVFSIDNSGYLTSINSSMAQHFQIKNPKLAGMHFRTILNKEQLNYFNGLSEELRKSDEESVSRNYHLAFGKKKIHVSMQLSSLKKAEGEPLGKLLVVEDITELDRSTRARAWREVARRIAHEIKNPLTPIQLNTQRIRRKYLEEIEDPRLLDTCTATVIKEVDSLKNMVNEFSKFARLPEINPEPLNLNKILEEVALLFKPGLRKNIRFSLELDESVPNTLIDGEQMKRVFTNLIDNALAAVGEDEGEIGIASSFSKDLKIVTAKIVDTGCGIPAPIANRIFDPYVSTKKEGTGLGLAIVSQIISDHGGFIRIAENQPKGTIFIVELPA